MIALVVLCLNTVDSLSSFLQRKDLLQLMMDASDEETKEGLTNSEIVADTVGFMTAGYETTSMTLTAVTYLLALHSVVQERLANEIHDYFEENPVSVNIHSPCNVHVLV